MPKAPEELIQINTRRQVFLERNKSHEELSFLPFLKKMRDQVQEQLDSDITALNRRQMEARIRSLSKAIESTQLEYKDVWLEQIRENATVEAEFQARAMNTATDLDFKLPSPNQLNQAVMGTPMSIPGINGGQVLDGFFTGVMENDVKRMSGIIRLGYAQGATRRQITQSIIGTIGNKFKDGELDKFKRSARMITRTSLSHSSNMSRQALYEANRKVVKGVEWVSTLDSKTSTQCQALDGQVFPLDSGPRPPIHPGERSTTVAAFDSRFNFLKKDATRASKGADDLVKPTAANQSYYSWLKTQNTDFQDSAVGARWGRLLRDGELSSQRFAELRLNNDFQPSTLLEISELEPLALRKAGMMVNDAGNIANIPT